MEASPKVENPVKPASADAGSASGMSKKEKKALKKQKAKAAKDEGDDLDKALAELALKHPELKHVVQNAPATKASSKLFSLLAVSLSHLDAEAEMRKFFGSKVVAASKASSSGGAGAQGRRQPTAVRSSLTRPQPTWWPANYRQGLSSRILSEQELTERRIRHQWPNDVPGERIWSVEYSRKYRGLTKMFIQMVMAGGELDHVVFESFDSTVITDPEGLFQLLRSFPYHADTLLQLSEVYFHREGMSSHAQCVQTIY